VRFDYEDTDIYRYIPATIPADTSFPFYLMSHWACNFFSLPDGNTLDTNHDAIKVYSYNRENYYVSLPKLDLSHVFLHSNLSCYIANDYVCETMTENESFNFKEYPLDSMNESWMISSQKNVHICFKRLELEYEMLYRIGTDNSFEQQTIFKFVIFVCLFDNSSGKY
jgi:hypothetical protein